MFPNNPLLSEMLVKAKQDEIRREMEGNHEQPAFRARSEVWVIVILLVVLIWFLM